MTFEIPATIACADAGDLAAAERHLAAAELSAAKWEGTAWPAAAHRVVVLRHGRVVEQGDADTVFAHPREDYTRALMAAAFALEA